ncbi:hypothetical protein [Paraburkholderia phenazinium]|uniref:Uncharacterized protein n=1 Tax=Paraburkholderia phenazinium TaxID=60549 RepID=A0A1N6FU47_9BURK|nr:hypothetical protein [Paraburkholderia phenazinium]SIN98778.1 hypothetical protein SAMN05444165_0392 [Paraburkholderia phenazinium]
MTDITAYATVTNVTTTSGTRLTCEPYLSHPQFSHDNELCAQLHYTFLHYAPNRSQSKALEVRQALVVFLDFRQKYHQLNPLAVHLNSISDLTGDVIRQFERYLQKECKIGNLRMRAETPLARLKSALNYVAEHTGEIPQLRLPAIRYDRSNKTEPLDESTFTELEGALRKHADSLWTLLENRIKVQSAEPYTFAELSMLVNPPVNCENLVRWYQYALLHHVTRPAVATIREYLGRSDDPILISMRKLPTAGGKLGSAWKAYYDGDGAIFRLQKPINPFGTSVANLHLDEFRVLKTLIQCGYPLEMSLQELQEKYDSQMKTAWFERTGTVLECLLPYCYQRRSSNVETRPTVAQLLYTYYPSDIDMATLILFLMVQTGWNKETVLAIDPKNFEAKLSGLLAEDEMTIFSEKNRSQGSQLPYHNPKLYKATSSRTNKYSAYNLVKLAEALSEPFAAQSVDFVRTGHDETRLNKLFSCLRHPGAWGQFGRFYTLSAESLFKTGVKGFLKLYPIHASGRRLSKVEEISPKLRPTWVMMHRKMKPLSVISLIQGHESPETTDIYYDSSGLAMKERSSRLRAELETVGGLLRTRQFTGLIGEAPTPAQMNEGLTIFFLPGHEKNLWGCRNRLTPDWPGFQQRFTAGQKCHPSTNCFFCSQCYVFEDSLPYLIDRHAQIEEALANAEESDFSSTLNAEREVIDWLISNWNDDKVLQSAFAYQQQHSPLFPIDHAAFEVLFDDSEVTVG